jgi:hypothetical protein
MRTRPYKNTSCSLAKYRIHPIYFAVEEYENIKWGMEAAGINNAITRERRNTMRILTRGICMIVVLSMVFVAPAFAAGTREGGYSPEMQAKIEQMEEELKKYTDDKATAEQNLKTFDELDFVVFSNAE